MVTGRDRVCHQDARRVNRPTGRGCKRGGAGTAAHVFAGAMLVMAASSCAGGGHQPDAQGVDGVSAVALARRGVYLGPPGRLPAGVPKCANLAPASTTGTGPSAPSTGSMPSEPPAVRGDPANGKATVTSRAAVATALANRGGFVGTVTAGSAVLVQLKDIYACVVATAWAVPLTGMVQLSCGPAPTDGGTTAPCRPRPGQAVLFVDAVTGRFISELGLGAGSS